MTSAKAAHWLDKKRAVTGFLLPAAGDERRTSPMSKPAWPRPEPFHLWRGPSAQEKHT